MKSTLALLTLGLLVSCGKHTHTKYIENPFDNSANEARLTEIEQRVSALESSVALNISQIAGNSSSILNLQSSFSSEVLSLSTQINALQTELGALDSSQSVQIAALEASLADLEVELSQALGQGLAAYNTINGQITALQSSNSTLNSSVSTLQGQMAQLQLSERVTEVINPCAQTSGYDEVLFRMNSGKVVAYFESGSQRFMTVLKQNTNYQTTDLRACKFYLDSANVVKPGTVPAVVSNIGITSNSCAAVQNGHCACTVANPNNRPNICTELGLSSNCTVQFGGQNANEAGFQCANICSAGYFSSCVK